jgi:predicted P-loop ATPase
MQLAGVWLIELSELDSLTRADAGRIKAFMSRSCDRFRPPYGHRIIEAPRQCVFVGTSNRKAYLKDETGGRRFWPIRCGEVIRIRELARDRDQLWAEAKDRYNAGAHWWLEGSDVIAEAAIEQAARYDSDPWEGPIETWSEGKENITVEQVLTFCLDKPRAQRTQIDENRVARCLQSLGWKRFKKRTTGDSREWRYRRPEALK